MSTLTSKVRVDSNGRQHITLYRVNEEYQPVEVTNPHAMKVYVIGIGWNRTYLSYRSTRITYSTYFDRLNDLKRDIRSDAIKLGDEIIEWRFVYTHGSKAEVKRIMNAQDYRDYEDELYPWRSRIAG